MEEIFGLPLINNPIPANETNNFGGYNNVATANDLSDLFVPGTIPAAPSLSVTEEGFVQDHHSKYYSQEVRITNNGTSPVSAPLWLVLDKGCEPNTASVAVITTARATSTFAGDNFAVSVIVVTLIMSAKETLLDIAEKLPPDATLVDAIYELEFRQAVQQGLDELDRGEGIPIEQVKAKIASWAGK
jgi:hypothetical protein